MHENEAAKMMYFSEFERCVWCIMLDSPCLWAFNLFVTSKILPINHKLLSWVSESVSESVTVRMYNLRMLSLDELAHFRGHFVVAIFDRDYIQWRKSHHVICAVLTRYSTTEIAQKKRLSIHCIASWAQLKISAHFLICFTLTYLHKISITL
jgi:hypothetical protein